MLKKAVALAYNEQTIPIVVAKGKEKMALQIIQKAREFNVPIFQNKELVDSLININVDDFIAEEHYLAVAKILVWLHENEENAQSSK